MGFKKIPLMRRMGGGDLSRTRIEQMGIFLIPG